MDIGLLLIRLALGLTLAAHGSQKLFGLFGGHGIAGTARFMDMLGFRPGRRNAEIAGAAEVGAGLLFATGLLTPLAAAVIIGVMIVAGASAHAGKGFFLTAGGWEYTFILAAVAAGIAFTGAGVVSLDRLLDLDLGGPLWGVLALALGGGAGVAQLSMRRSDERAGDVDLRDATETPAPAEPRTDIDA